MQIPADRIAKRLSADEGRARYDRLGVKAAPQSGPRARSPKRMLPPADRIAVRCQ